MSRLPRFGSALSALALASVIAGCAGPMSRQGHVVNLNKANVGLAMRAQLALAAGEFRSAVDLAEQAVDKTPNDAGMRGLLGNVYFGSGRFASAEAAYRDSLALSSNQPKVVLKMALVQIAQGKNNEAIAFLNAAQNVLDPADYGLALALAGQPQDAIYVLEPAARAPGADARVRQNLALAFGLSGDWQAARTIAAQDLSPDQVGPRIQQWMALAKPVRASDQVAALIGVTPAAADPGQPARLALRDNGQRLAELAVPKAPAAQPPEQPVELPAMTAFAPVEADVPAVMPEYHEPTIAAAFQAPAAEELVSAPVAAVAAAEPASPPPLVAALAPQVDSPKQKAPAAAKPRDGNAGVVVQLGAYSSPARVEAAWEQISDRHGDLRQYTPTSARFDGPKGTVYRLSVKGFSSLGEASGLCSSLRRQGKACFVRGIAGDSPAQFASR